MSHITRRRTRRPEPFFRKDRKLWYVQLDGRQHNLGCEKQAAYRRYRELLSERDFKQRWPVDETLVLDVFEKFLDWELANRAAATFKRDSALLKDFAKSIAREMRVSDLKVFHVQQWVDSKQLKSSTSQRNCIACVKAALNWAAQQGLIPNSPIAGMRKPAATARDNPVSLSDFQAMLEMTQDEEFRDLLELAWHTGARAQELWRVEAAHVQLDKARWVLPKAASKGRKKPRIVHLNDHAVVITRRLLAKHPSGSLLRNTKGQPWCGYSVNCRFSRLKRKLGKRYCLTDFRHSFATRGLQNNADPMTVAFLMGHRDLSMLANVYGHLSHDSQHVRNILDQMTCMT